MAPLKPVMNPLVLITSWMLMVSCGRSPEVVPLSGPTDIAPGMEFRKAEGILLGGRAMETQLAMVPVDPDKDELHPFDLPDGSLILLVVTKGDGRIARIAACDDPSRPKGERKWVGVQKYTVDPGKARLRRERLESGILAVDAAEYLKENGAVKTQEKTEEFAPGQFHTWHTYRLDDGTELKFWVRKGYPGAWDFQTRSAGKEWEVPGRIWLKRRSP